MKKTLLVAGALLALTATAASAAGFIQLGWGDCATLGPATAAVTNACTSNSGSVGQLIASFEPPAHMGNFNGHEGVLDLQTNAATLSLWWHMEATGCRNTALSGSFDFTAGPFTCIDVWAGQASGGINYGAGIPTPNRARIKTVCAVPDAFQQIIDPGSEYYCFKLSIGKVKSVGAACPGCLDAACIVLNSIKIVQPAGLGDYTLTTGAQQTVLYNGGIPGGNCYSITPTKNTTWGTIKSMYR